MGQNQILSGWLSSSVREGISHAYEVIAAVVQSIS
jgi:hypothetical protein